MPLSFPAPRDHHLNAWQASLKTTLSGSMLSLLNFQNGHDNENPNRACLQDFEKNHSYLETVLGAFLLIIHAYRGSDGSISDKGASSNRSTLVYFAFFFFYLEHLFILCKIMTLNVSFIPKPPSPTDGP